MAWHQTRQWTDTYAEARRRWMQIARWFVALAALLAVACGSEGETATTTTTAADGAETCESPKEAPPVAVADVLEAAPRWWEALGPLEVQPFDDEAKLTILQDARFQPDPVLLRAESARPLLGTESEPVTAVIDRETGELGVALARDSRLIIAPRARGTWLIEVSLGERLKVVLSPCGRARITPLAEAAEGSDGFFTELDIVRGLQSHDAEIEALYQQALAATSP
jgi:hypothetical protein